MSFIDPSQYDPTATSLFTGRSPGGLLSGCIGLDETGSQPLRLAFNPSPSANLLVLGRSSSSALGLFSILMLDLASQLGLPLAQRDSLLHPSFGVLDFLCSADSLQFSSMALSLPMPVKLELAPITHFTSLGDLEYEIANRTELSSALQPRFLFVCGLQAAHNLRQLGAYASVAENRYAPQFRRLLEEGPPRRLHTIVWCNTYQAFELTLSNGFELFGSVLLLDDSGIAPAEILGGSSAPSAAYHIDMGLRTCAVFVPFGLPPQRWCDSAIRAFSRPTSAAGA